MHDKDLNKLLEKLANGFEYEETETSVEETGGGAKKKN